MTRVPHQKIANQPFAEALRALRERADKSTYAVARKCMGWSSETPYILMEQGRRMPDQETIIRLTGCLEGSFADQCLLLGLAGYLPPIQVPALDQIKRELAPIIETIRSYPYPVYILDRGFTYWVANPAAKMLVSQAQDVTALGQRHATAFDLAFDSRLGIAARIGNVEALRYEQLRRFKGLNVLHQHESFYKMFLNHMAERLQPEDYTQFIEYWEATAIEQRFTAALQELGYVSFNVSESVKVEFNFFGDRVFFLGDFFELVRFNPVPMPDNLQTAESLFGFFRDSSDDCFCIWDVTDADAILDRYR